MVVDRGIAKQGQAGVGAMLPAEGRGLSLDLPELQTFVVALRTGRLLLPNDQGKV